jgi:hypothetical protein
VILKNADLLASLYVEDLGGAVAASRDVLAVMAEAHAADDALMNEGVYEVNVKHALHLRVENGVPISAELLVLSWERFDIEVTEVVTNRRGSARATHASMVGGRMANLW